MKSIVQLIHNIKRLLFAGSLLLTAALPVTAQRADTLAGYRQFMAVCNTYKTLPLQAVVQVHTYTAMPGVSSDTVKQEAVFHLDTSGSYIRYGEVEQLANDSLLLLVSSHAEKMILYSGKQRLADQLQKMSGLWMADSSVQRLAQFFTVQAEQGGQEGSAALLLQSRLRLPVSGLPRQEIAIRYVQQTGEPVKVVQTSRELVPLEAAEYTLLQHQPGNEKQLVVVNGQYYMIRERADVFYYQSVSHQRNSPLPVQLADRITRGASGDFQPAAAYKDYSLTLF